MKRFLIWLCLCGTLQSVSAQRSYVTVYCAQDAYESIKLSGDIPPTMQTYYDPYYDFSKYNGFYCIGDVLNLLAKNGFVVEQMNTATNKEKVYTTYLLSKTQGDEPLQTALRTTKTEEEEKVKEVARYNLQGVPVRAEEKGVQIVVFSNFTTRTVVVE